MNKILLFITAVLQLTTIVVIVWCYNSIVDDVYDANDTFVKACGATIGNE